MIEDYSMNLRFSVVIPSYRQGHFIQRTIDSILSQAVSFDLLVIDGGSQDETLNILSSYDSRIRWISEPDKGQADAVNKGISISTGEIIAWLNSDDIYFPRALEKVEAVFARYPDVQVVYGNADWIDEHDNTLKSFPAEPWRYQRLKETCFLCQPAVFFRRSLVEKYGGLDQTLQYCMDYELWLRYGQHVDFYYLPEKLAGSRMYSSNKTVGQTLAAHAEINTMIQAKLGHIPANWLLAYALVQVEKEHGVSRFDQSQTSRFVALLVRLCCRELWYHNPFALLKIVPKIPFWFLMPDRAWFRNNDILVLS